MSEAAARCHVATWSKAPSEIVRPGVRRRAFGNEGVMLVMNEIEPGMQPSPHVHESFDQIATIVSGQALYHVGDEAHRVGPGSLLLIPAGVVHWIEPVDGSRIENLDIFAPPRADYEHLVAWMK
jgi:quercetin dioxygenase-like cupin family protein